MSKTKVWVTVGVCAAAAIALAAALRLAAPSNDVEDPVNNLIPIETVAPVTADLANQMDFIGSLSAGDSVAVIPKLTAKVREVKVKAGDTVKAGDVLYIMDTADLDSQVQLAQLALDSAKLSHEMTTETTLDLQEDQAYIQYRQARSAYEAAEDAYGELVKDKKDKEAAMQQAIDLTTEALTQHLEENWGGMTAQQALAAAKQQANDAQTAWEANGASMDPSDPYYAAKREAAAAQSALEGLTDANQQAVSALSAYKSALGQAGAGLDAAETGYKAARLAYDAVSDESRETQENLAGMQLKQAEINYNSLMDQLKNATVTAPVDGTVLSVGVQENNYATTSSVVMLGSDQSMKVTFGLPANYFGQVQVGDSATVEATGGSVSATVTEVAPMLNPQTGTFSVTAEFVNTAGFLSGANAKVTLTTQHAEDVLTLPVDCVRFEENRPYVYLEEEGFARKVFITLGMTDEEVYEVTDGLTAADRVISTWHPNLADGAAVAVQ